MRATKKRGSGQKGKRGRGKGEVERGKFRSMVGNKHKGDGHHARRVKETPDVSHIKNVDVTHEASDVSVEGVLKFVGGLTTLGIVVFVLMWGLFRFLSAQETE
jgi:hypothetical protein